MVIPKRMQMGRKGIELLKRLEGCSLAPYKDEGGFMTIGYGHKMKITEEHKRITLEQAEILLGEDLDWAVNAVNNYVDIPLSQNEFDALTIFTFNVGEGAFRTSTLLEKLNNNNKLAVPAEMLRWRFTGGKESRGLVRRRLATAKLFIG